MAKAEAIKDLLLYRYSTWTLRQEHCSKLKTECEGSVTSLRPRKRLDNLEGAVRRGQGYKEKE